MTSALLDAARSAVRSADLVRGRGRLTQVVGLVLEVRGLCASIGDLCWIEVGRQLPEVPAEVVGFREDALLLMPYGSLIGIAAGSRVRTHGERLRVPAGVELLGRVLNAVGEPIDGGPPLSCRETTSHLGRVPPPLARQRIREVQPTGVRAIDAFVTCARGQRVGIFAGSGVGKSVLLGMISRHSAVDVNVVALIGERGREVREFIEEDLGQDGLARSVVVVATSDESAVLRVRAAQSAMAIAEWFREHDRNVMFLMDSTTRYAMALREIGLAVGEPPTTKGYTPSSFAELPRLLERAGTSRVNAMTGFFTVLVEGDDLNDPVGDAVRAIVDGHIVLARDLARRGHYPAIDVLGSVSRLMPQVTTPEHRASSARVLNWLKLLEDHQDLITIGAYTRGHHAELDIALDLRPRLDAFLRQGIGEKADLSATLAQLAQLATPGATG